MGFWVFTPNPKTTLLRWWLRLRSRSPPKKRSASLVGGFNPSEKYAHQIGSFPQVGRNTKNIFKTTNHLSMLSTLYPTCLPDFRSNHLFLLPKFPTSGSPTKSPCNEDTVAATGRNSCGSPGVFWKILPFSGVESPEGSLEWVTFSILFHFSTAQMRSIGKDFSDLSVVSKHTSADFFLHLLILVAPAFSHSCLLLNCSSLKSIQPRKRIGIGPETT